MILILAAIIFLFNLYILSKDDFVLMRKNVSQRMVFDIAFTSGIVGIFLSRIAYVSMHPSTAYLNPLVFLIIPYFPGLSAAGFILGMCLTVYIYAARKKLPKGKLFDIFTLSLLVSAETIFFVQSIVALPQKYFFQSALNGVCFFVLLVLYFLLKRLSVTNSVKDGSVALIGLAGISVVVSFVQLSMQSFASMPRELPYFVAILLLLLVSFIIRFVKRRGSSE